MKPQTWQSLVNLLTLLAASTALACSPISFKNHIYSNDEVSYRVGALPSAWQRFSIDDGNLAFRHTAGGTILANGMCADVNDVPLDVLINQALFGVAGKSEQPRERFLLDGREAMRARVSGQLDGVDVALDLVVLRKDECVYDLQLVAGREVFAAREPDFERFMRAFAQVGGHK